MIIIFLCYKNEHFSNIEELKDKAKTNAASRQRKKTQENTGNDDFVPKNNEINDGYSKINHYSGNNTSSQSPSIDIEIPPTIPQDYRSE